MKPCAEAKAYPGLGTGILLAVMQGVRFCFIFNVYSNLVITMPNIHYIICVVNRLTWMWKY
jgi:hypothetical protein